MLPVLVEMERLELLTPEETQEINGYVTDDLRDWLKVPMHLASKAQHAMWLMQFDPDQPGTVAH